MLEAGASIPDDSELNVFCRARLAGYKRPRRYQWAADIGRNALGKINKRELRLSYLAGALG